LKRKKENPRKKQKNKMIKIKFSACKEIKFPAHRKSEDFQVCRKNNGGFF
jgi:hypothetical protein